MTQNNAVRQQTIERVGRLGLLLVALCWATPPHLDQLDDEDGPVPLGERRPT
jgi:hypothetical protein